MRRLLTLLVILALTWSNGAALASAVCQHGDARAHVAALHSEDAAIAAAALGEESAAKSVERKGARADLSAGALAGLMMPPEAPAVPIALRHRSELPAAHPSRLSSRSLRPLLEPPLA